MSTRLYLLLVVIFSFLQGSLLPVVFTEGILLILFLLEKPDFKLAPTIFLAGLIFDLIQNQSLGVTSILFLLILLLFNLTNDWFQVQKSLVLAIASSFICALRSWFVLGYLPYLEMLVIFVLSYVLFSVFIHPSSRGKIRL